MNAKILFAIALISIVISTPGLANYQIVPVGKCNVSLDFGGEIMEIETSETSFTDDFAMDMTAIHEEGTVSTNFGIIYLYDFAPSSKRVDDIPSMLEKSVIEAFCARTSIDPYMDGYVQTGLFKTGGRKCWGIAMPLDAFEERDIIDRQQTRCTKALMIFAFFKNETLNEHLVKTAKY
ncbi:MAG: hypothetical protein NTY47_07395 [Candidatus Omnitrophica bacterium]|nr:hypothetical protein [Candidatus Omnitrophota bacterium]